MVSELFVGTDEIHRELANMYLSQPWHSRSKVEALSIEPWGQANSFQGAGKMLR